VGPMIALRPRLGLGIGGGRVSAVLIDGDAVRWASTRPRVHDEPLTHTIGALLAACPRSRFRPPIVIAAVGPAAAQLKLVTDLPPLAQPSVLAAVVREHASRFFLKNGIPLLFSDVRTISATSAWIASFEEPVVRDTIAACTDAGLTLGLVTPAAVALRLATSDLAILWYDDDVDLAVRYANGAPASARSAPSTGAPREVPRFLSAFAALTGREAELMDAAGAARVPRAEPIALRGQALRLTKEPSRRRLAVSGAVCAGAIIAALLVPAIASWRVARQAHVLDAAVQQQVRGAERDARELASVTSALGALAAFTQSRRSLTLLLAQLTRALPEGSALLAFQVDSAGTGSIVAVAPRAAAVVDAVERVPGFASPEIVGPVTREAAAGKQLDRVTVRFHVVPDAAP
ncbi:MAG: PilN domain-containing protein, partial [Gemmatimonadaceae bacterium]